MIPPVTHSLQPTSSELKLREAAVELEANFLAEMLKGVGLGESPSAFGGGAGAGAGEEQFSSMLRLEQARELAKSGGIGLAETLFQALKEAPNEH